MGTLIFVKLYLNQKIILFSQISIIKKIITNADPVIDKNIFYPLNKEYQRFVGSYYSPFKIKKLLDEIDELIEINNLQFIEHNVEEIIEKNSIIVKFNIYEGEKTLVERINILGNSITNESVIRGEMELDEGDPFNKLLHAKSINNLKSKNIFQKVSSEIVDTPDANLKNIDITVEEKATGEILVGAGVGSEGGTAQFSISENNFLGKGIKLSTGLRLSAERVRGNFTVTNPNFNYLEKSLTTDFFVTDTDKMTDSGYKSTNAGFSFGTAFD